MQASWDLRFARHFRSLLLLICTAIFNDLTRAKEFTVEDFLGWNTLYNRPPIIGPLADLIDTHTGLRIQGIYRGFLYGNVAGGRSTGASWNQELRLIGNYRFGFLSPTLDGLSLTGEVRWREGYDPNCFVGATRTFQPSHIVGGKYFRLRPFYLTYVSPEMFGIKGLLTLSGGWQDPYDLFLQQPLSKLFVNHAIYTAKGLGANIPWNSSYAAWGGYFKIVPTSWLYHQTGFYVAAPGSNATQNHGADFEGSRIPGKPNGLFVVTETGLTPEFGPEKLSGKYVFGAYWYGAQPDNVQWKTGGNGRFGFYWQMDQLIFRVPSRSNNNGGSNPQELSLKGLYFFSLFTYAPPYNNTMPFYFHIGLNYQGLIPKREHDELSIGYGYGLYGKPFAHLTRSNNTPPLNSQAVFEIDYRCSLTSWLACKAYYQLLINPAANNIFKNANILGLAITSTF